MADTRAKQACILSAFSECLAAAGQANQRRLMLISGEQQWTRESLKALLSSTLPEQVLCVAEQGFLSDVEVVSVDKAKQLLGTETQLLIYDAYSGFNPDAFAAVCGTVAGGGVVVLLTPELDEWHNYLDPDYKRLLVHPYTPHQLEHLFIKRVAQCTQAAAGTWFYSQAKGLSKNTVAPVVTKATLQLSAQDNLSRYCLTEDQATAVQAICKVVKGHRRRPLVLTADRGRGKSAALGLAAGHLLAGGLKRIIVTAPKLQAVRPVFEMAKQILQVDECEAGVLCTADFELRYLPPDYLLRNLPKLDLLLVDEAAAIPLAMLQTLVAHYSRVVFSSTVHGYEGSGRGFGIRFQQILAETCPQWKALEIKTPIRWADNDPVEAWLFDALLMDADYQQQLPSTLAVEECEVKEVPRRDLLKDEFLLRQVFALLVLAHYQTTPSDLRNLLDGPNIRVWVLTYKAVVIATALVTEEGGFDAQLSAAIWKGERRLRGHLLPQTLAAHAGIEKAPAIKYQRIMRIAVQPQLQQQGLGQALLSAISDSAQRQKVDILGSSFGVTDDVLHFWQRGGYTPVRLGVSRDACSGTHSALVLKAFSLSGEIILDTARYKFLDHFPHQLLTMFNHLEPELVAGLILSGEDQVAIFLDEQDWLDITAFAEGYRVLEVCSVPLWKLACCFLGQLEVRQWLSDQQRDLLIYLILQNRPMPWVAAKLCYSGRKELINSLRACVKLLSQHQTLLRPSSIH